jgi:hypothetical protein
MAALSCFPIAIVPPDYPGGSRQLHIRRGIVAEDYRLNVFLAEQSGSDIYRFADIVEASRDDTEQGGLNRISLT